MTRDQNKGINLANSENNAGVNPTVAYGDDSYSAEGKAATESFEALYEAERRARAEATARANELEAIFEAMADAVFFYDRQGHLLRTNAAARELLGLDQSPGYHSLPPDERLVHFLPRDARGRPLPEQQWPIHRILSGEGLTGANAMDMMVRLPDGRELEFSVSGAPLRDTKGNITGGVVITRDVTERRRLERMAQGFAREAVARASQLEATIEAMADGVFIYDAEGRLLQANKAARELLALDIQLDFLSRPVRERASQTLVRDEQGQFLPREQWPLHRILRGEILEGTNAVDVMLRALDGREVLLGTSGAPVRDAEGHIAGGVLIMRDVTERRHLEQRTHDSLNALLAIARILYGYRAKPVPLKILYQIR